MTAKQIQKEVGAVLFLGRACSEGRDTASQAFGFASLSLVHDILEVDRWMDGWMDGWVGEWLAGWVDVWMDEEHGTFTIFSPKNSKEKYKHI